MMYVVTIFKYETDEEDYERILQCEFGDLQSALRVLDGFSNTYKKLHQKICSGDGTLGIKVPSERLECIVCFHNY